MRCKICGISKRVRGVLKLHSWEVNQHCAECHFMGRIPRGIKAKNYPKR
jgi:uncharacterized Zn finger protein